jgi:pimeloyl-ACP methyl ester carboxylesterase
MLIIAFLSVVILGVVGLSFFIAEKTLQPRHRNKKKTPSDFGMKYEDVWYRHKGHSYHGWMIRAADEVRPTVVFVHGWESSAQGMLPHAQFMRDLGLHMFLFDARGHGDSDPSDFMSLVRMSEDLDAALDYVVTRSEVDTARLLVFGHSMGGATAVMVAARRPGLRGLVVSSAFSDFRKMTRDMLRSMHLPYWPFGPLLFFFWNRKLKIDINEWHPVVNMRKVDVPVFLAHGTDDETLADDHFTDLTHAARNPQALVIPHGRHRNLHEFEVYRQSIREFALELLSREGIQKAG